MDNPEVWLKDVAGCCEQNRNEYYVYFNVGKSLTFVQLLTSQEELCSMELANYHVLSILLCILL
jgi:hypothetical protein